MGALISCGGVAGLKDPEVQYNLKIDPASVSIDVGETTNLTLIGFGNNVSEVTLSNSTSGVVSNYLVSSNITITGLSPGVVTITAAAVDGAHTAQASISVGTPKNFSYQGIGCPLDHSQLLLNWDPVVNAANYQVYRDNNLEGSPTTNTLTLTGLTNGVYSLEVKACNGENCSGPAALTVTVASNDFSDIILSRRIPSDLASYDQISRAIFSTHAPGAALVTKYVKQGGTGDGSSYSNAAGDVKAVLDGITNASASNVYAILVAPGIYNAGAEMAMKNNAAIVGGVSQCLGVSSDPGDTTLSGGGNYRVFYNNGITNTAVLYGVTITNGNTTGNGGGINNRSSSPLLIRVTLSGNTANFGGGMYNQSSSPVLTGVTLSGNRATSEGGGMYNQSSSPILTGGTLSGNRANFGSGMRNLYSSPILTGVTLSGNTAARNGGGMYNQSSSPLLTGVTLSGNTATSNGGGMYNDNDGEAGPRLVNTIIWSNTATTGNQIYFNNDSSSQENLRLYNSIVEGGLPAGYISGTNTNSFNGGGFASEGSTASIVVDFSSITTANPALGSLADNGSGVLTHAIASTSPAVDQGIYVKRSAAPTGRGCLYFEAYHCNTYTFYYSDNKNTWFSDLELTTEATLIGNEIDLTAADATGYTRTGRPDIGAYEAR